jgi:hypothetical protein
LQYLCGSKACFALHSGLEARATSWAFALMITGQQRESSAQLSTTGCQPVVPTRLRGDNREIRAGFLTTLFSLADP